jgi:hypothetical protein
MQEGLASVVEHNKKKMFEVKLKEIKVNSNSTDLRGDGCG